MRIMQLSGVNLRGYSFGGQVVEEAVSGGKSGMLSAPVVAVSVSAGGVFPVFGCWPAAVRGVFADVGLKEVAFQDAGDAHELGGVDRLALEEAVDVGPVAKELVGQPLHGAALAAELMLDAFADVYHKIEQNVLQWGFETYFIVRSPSAAGHWRKAGWKGRKVQSHTLLILESKSPHLSCGKDCAKLLLNL